MAEGSRSVAFYPIELNRNQRSSDSAAFAHAFGALEVSAVTMIVCGEICTADHQTPDFLIDRRWVDHIQPRNVNHSRVRSGVLRR
ncbi:hypothetical protein N7495_003415 [Penicillium taxi]|uniref:uncharacterized protein n=1 Tax=Penicillium taxi TaxID=168475 RepID=UPI002545AE88|nr:uncharacterized protein N7495_003415 [Penicillium taxi]KAJ5902887.1 hypothetical protein N7495_003415 [Penicillium taxi]